MLNEAVVLGVSFPEEWLPLWVSLKTAGVATLITSGLGLLAAGRMRGHSQEERKYGWALVDGLLTLPLVLPPTVVGFFLLLLLGRNSPIGQLLSLFNISVVFTWEAVVVAAVVVSFPLMYRTSLAALMQVDSTLVSAARTLGASEWRIFWQILLPLACPGILAGVVLAFARSLGEFGATLMVGGSILGATQTMPIALFFAAESGRFDVALAWVMAMVAVALGAIAFINSLSGKTPANSSLVWMQKGFDWIYFGRLDVDSDRPSVPAFVQNRETGRSQLSVDISKHLSLFQLDTCFNVCSQPLGILGASGSGKSLTLRCIAGLERPTKGRIVLNGRALFDSKQSVNVAARDRKVGFVFQNYALFPHLTVAQNIAFGMDAVKKEARLSVVVGYLAQMGLMGLGDRYPHQLSGGQQQRVALARALAIQPDILLLDEPLAALDTYLRSRIERLLVKTLSDYPGVALMVTHKLEEAYRLCPRLVVLSKGQVLAADAKEEIFWHPPTFEVAQVTECKNFSRAVAVGENQVDALDWDCLLETSADPVDKPWLGIRAHHIQFLTAPDSCNTFPVWIAAMSETQHRVTMYLKLNGAPTSIGDYHLQAEVYREKWNSIKNAEPLFVKLDPAYLILMSD